MEGKTDTCAYFLGPNVCNFSGLDYYYRRYHRHVNKRRQYWDWSSSEGISGTGNAASPWQRQLAVAETGDRPELRAYIEWIFGRIQSAVIDKRKVDANRNENSVLWLLLPCYLIYSPYYQMPRGVFFVVVYYGSAEGPHRFVKISNARYLIKSGGCHPVDIMNLP